MPLLDDVRRWAKDKFSQDEMIDGTPKEKLREAERALPQLSQSERTRTLEHVQAYATYYYEGHQRERVPAEVRQELAKIEKQVERMNSVDAARETLHRYGGAPTMHTIAESLERSEKEREANRVAVKQPEAQRESLHETETPSYRMRM